MNLDKYLNIKIMNVNKHIWEGWTVKDFIEHLEVTFDYHNFNSKQEVINWCKSEQPYYKKHIPEVSNYFIAKANL